MENFIEKVVHIAKNEGISIASLEKSIGASKGVLGKAISKNSDIQAKWVIKIAAVYPNYSAEWLLRDELPIYKSKIVPCVSTSAVGKDAVAVGFNTGTITQPTDTDTVKNCQDMSAILIAKDKVIETQEQTIRIQQMLIDELQKHTK